MAPVLRASSSSTRTPAIASSRGRPGGGVNCRVTERRRPSRLICGDAFVRTSRARLETLVTPPAADGALPGITRDTVLRCARDAGWDAAERTLSRYELMHAGEAFLCGSGAGLVAVASLDDTPIGVTGSAPSQRDRPALAALTAAYAEAAQQLGTPWAGALEPA